jgi:hypothetical protein
VADRRDNVATTARRALAASAAAIVVALLLTTPGRAERPVSHARDPARYSGIAPAPGEVKPGPAAKPAAPAKPPASAASPLDDPEYRFGQGKLRPRRGDPRETVDGKPLWNTDDPPDKRGPFAFLGNRIGDPIERLFPRPESEKDKYGMLLCRETPGVPGFLDCADDSIGEFVDGRWTLRFRGVEASFLNYRYLDRKLVGFDLGFPVTAFKQMAEAVDRLYGPPDKEDKYDWRNLRGAGFDVRMLTWHTPHGAMVLRSHGAALDSGMLSLFEPKAEQRYADLRFRQVTPSEAAPAGKPAAVPPAPYDPYDR